MGLETLTEEHESGAEANSIDESVIRALLMSSSPKPLRTHLQLKRYAWHFHAEVKPIGESSNPDGMDIDTFGDRSGHFGGKKG